MDPQDFVSLVLSSGIVAGRVGVTCRTMVLKHCPKSCMQLPSILYAALSSLSVKPLIVRVTDLVQ